MTDKFSMDHLWNEFRQIFGRSSSKPSNPSNTEQDQETDSNGFRPYPDLTSAQLDKLKSDLAKPNFQDQQKQREAGIRYLDKIISHVEKDGLDAFKQELWIIQMSQFPIFHSGLIADIDIFTIDKDELLKILREKKEKLSTQEP